MIAVFPLISSGARGQGRADSVNAATIIEPWQASLTEMHADVEALPRVFALDASGRLVAYPWKPGIVKDMLRDLPDTIWTDHPAGENGEVYQLSPTRFFETAQNKFPHGHPIQARRRVTTQPVPESLIAEAPILPIANGLLKYVFLPITIGGKTATIILDTGAPVGLSLSYQQMATLGMPAPHDGILDSLTIGTTVLRNVEIERGGFATEVPAGLPPVIGLMGNHMLFHYDLLFDGPAHRVRMYLPPPTTTPTFSSAEESLAWLPSGMRSADCSPMIHHGEPEDHYPGLDLRVNGQAMVGTFDSGNNATVMNVAAAKMLGIRQSSPNVHATPDDSLTSYPGVGYQKEYVVTTGVVVTVAGRPLPDGPINIYQTVNEIYKDPTKPEFAVGTDLLRDRTLFLSYSHNQVCLSSPQVPSNPTSRSTARVPHPPGL